MNTFDCGQPKELLSLLRNFKIVIDGAGVTTPSGRINYWRTMLREQALREFDKLQPQYCGAINNHLDLIQECLLEYVFPINALLKQKCVMRRAMRKTWSIAFKRFTERLTEMNNFLPLFPGSEASKKMETEEINKVILHAVPNGRSKQSYLKGWDFKLNTYR